LALLKEIHAFFGVGDIYLYKDSASYVVTSFKDIKEVIIPHFVKYPLVTQKLADFLIFSQILELVAQKQHLTLEGLNKIISLKSSLNKGLSADLIEAFPSIKVIERIKVN